MIILPRLATLGDFIPGIWFKKGIITKEGAIRATELTSERCLMLRDETDLLDILRIKTKSRGPSFAKKVSLLTWRQQGLPPDVVRRLCSQYSSLSTLIQEVKQSRVPPSTEIDEISAVLNQDYYVE